MTLRKLLITVLAVVWVLTAAVMLAQDEVNITFASWDTGEGGERNQRIIDQFMEENPNINVQVEILESAEDPQVLIRMAAGTAPDVIQTGEISLLRFALAPEGGYLDLTPFIEADEGFDPFEEYFPEVFNVGMIGDAVYAFNKDFATEAYYVNTDMFEEAGVPIPEEGWTYDDLIQIAQELTLDANGNNALSPDFDPENIVQYGWWHPDGWVRGWQSIPHSFGAEQLLSDDGLTATGYLNSEEVAAAVQLYYDSVHTYHISPSIATQQAQEGVDLFASGQVAMRGPFGPWSITGYSENPDINFATVPMPAGPGGRFSVICWAGFSVNKNTEHPQEAYELVKYFATVGQNTFAEHALTANKAVAEQADYANDEYWAAFFNEIPNLHPIDDLKTPFWVECIYEPMYDLLTLVQSPEGVDVDIQGELDTIAANADTCLAQPWQ
jgi:multiple sugar transport system substrate-binding protein